MKRRTRWLGLWLAAFWLAAGGQAFAAGAKVHVAYTATGGFVYLFTAQEKGFFAAHGLDVELQLVGLNSTIPAAMVAGSIDIGGTTTTGLLQAVDSGIALVAVSGGTLSYRGSLTGTVLARTGAGIDGPAQLKGRKVGVPGIGAILHVFLEYWLLTSGVDPKSVTYVELGFLQMRDAMQSGLVDAVITAEPTLSAILKSGVGKEIGRANDALPRQTQGIVFTATAAWATAHRDEVRGFNAANAEAIDYVGGHMDEARAILAKHLKVSPALADQMELSRAKAEVTADELQVVIDIMTKLDLLNTKIDPASLLIR